MADDFKGLAPKYRIFKEPPWTEDIEPDVHAVFCAGYDFTEEGAAEVWLDLEPVEGFCFVLKPENDIHARSALHLYALLIEDDDPQLAKELKEVLR